MSCSEEFIYNKNCNRCNHMLIGDTCISWNINFKMVNNIKQNRERKKESASAECQKNIQHMIVVVANTFLAVSRYLIKKKTERNGI